MTSPVTFSDTYINNIVNQIDITEASDNVDNITSGLNDIQIGLNELRGLSPDLDSFSKELLSFFSRLERTIIQRVEELDE